MSKLICPPIETLPRAAVHWLANIAIGISSLCDFNDAVEWGKWCRSICIDAEALERECVWESMLKVMSEKRRWNQLEHVCVMLDIARLPKGVSIE